MKAIIYLLLGLVSPVFCAEDPVSYGVIAAYDLEVSDSREDLRIATAQAKIAQLEQARKDKNQLTSEEEKQLQKAHQDILKAQLQKELNQIARDVLKDRHHLITSKNDLDELIKQRKQVLDDASEVDRLANIAEEGNPVENAQMREKSSTMLETGEKMLNSDFKREGAIQFDREGRAIGSFKEIDANGAETGQTFATKDPAYLQNREANNTNWKELYWSNDGKSALSPNTGELWQFKNDPNNPKLKSFVEPNGFSEIHYQGPDKNTGIVRTTNALPLATPHSASDVDIPAVEDLVRPSKRQNFNLGSQASRQNNVPFKYELKAGMNLIDEAGNDYGVYTGNLTLSGIGESREVYFPVWHAGSGKSGNYSRVKVTYRPGKNPTYTLLSN